MGSVVLDISQFFEIHTDILSRAISNTKSHSLNFFLVQSAAHSTTSTQAFLLKEEQDGMRNILSKSLATSQNHFMADSIDVDL